MKNLQATILFCLMLACNVAMAGSSSQLSFVERIVNQIDYIEQQQQAVWPGFHPAATPSVIQFEGQNEEVSAYALNFKPGILPWQKIENADHPIYFLQDSSALKLDVDEVFAEVDGQSSFIDGESAKSYAIEENFVNKFMTKRAIYYFAHEAAIDRKNANVLRTPFDNFNNTTLLKLYLLEDAALTASQQADAGLAEDALRDAVAIHQYRNQLSSQAARAYENAHEIVVGTPFYIGWTSKQLNDEDYKKMSQRTGCTPLTGVTSPYSLTDCVQDGFLAFTSSAYGHALDKKLMGQPWKQNIEKQFKSISQVMIEYYRFNDQQAQTIATQAMKKPAYHYDRIERIVDFAMLPYLKNMRAAVSAYKTMPGIEFRAPTEFGEGLIIFGMFKKVFSDVFIVDSTKILLQDVNVVIPLDEADGSRENSIVFDHLPFVAITSVPKDFDVKSSDPASSFTSIRLTTKAKLTLDGVTILARDFVLRKKAQVFHQLIIDDVHFRFPLKIDGILEVKDNALQITGINQDQKLKQKQFFKKTKGSR